MVVGRAILVVHSCNLLWGRYRFEEICGCHIVARKAEEEVVEVG